MRLADVVDLEAQLAQDEGLDRERLHTRDRALAAAVGTGKELEPGGAAARPGEARSPTLPPGGPAAHLLLRRWLRALREREPQRVFPGRRVEATLRLLSVALVVVGLVLGWTTARVVLAYDGSQPVNVWDVLLVFVGVQLVLLVLLLVSFAFPVASLGVPLLGVVRGLTREAWRALALRVPASEERRSAWTRVFSRLRSRHRLYSDVEAWSLLALTQTFGVAFNLGALAAFARLVVFTDLAFAWSTTLDVDAGGFLTLVDALATPWARLVPSAVPSASLVEATRWSRLAGAYVSGAGAPAVEAVRAGGWWPFLVAALVTYGLLPRMVTLGVALARRSWLLSRLSFADLEVRALLARLTSPVVSTQAASPERAASASDAPRAQAAGLLTGVACDLVLWRDIPPDRIAGAVQSQLGATVASVREAGGRDHVALGPALDTLGAAVVVIAVDAWEPPDDALVEAVTVVRRRVDTRAVVVLLVGPEGAEPSAADVDVWARRLGRLADPHVAVEPMRRGPR